MMFCTGAEAASLFSMGMMAGVANDAGNIEKTAGNINMEMHAVAGADVKEIETTYTPVLALSLGYINDTLLIRGGWEYATNYFYNSSGSINNAGSRNKIGIDYSRYTFPLTLGIVIPLADRNRIYFGGGIDMSYALMKVKQSNPAAAPLTQYPGTSHTYSAFLTGKHISFGAEAVVSRNYSFSMEFTGYYGNNKKVVSEDKNRAAWMNVNSFEVTAGVKYNLYIKN